MFHTLSNVQRGEAIPLLRCIDNRDGRLSIGLRSITFAAGWYNIEKGEKFSWKNTAVEVSLTIPSDLYGFDRLQEVLKGARHTLTFCGENGLITLTVAPGWEILLSDGLLALLGLDDGLGRSPCKLCDAANAVGPSRRTQHIRKYRRWGSFDTPGLSRVGDINTVRMECPEFKRLRDGTISEFEGAHGKISNQDLPIHVALELVARK